MFPSNLIFFTGIPLFIMGRPFEVYFRFHVFLVMSVNCCICLTIECTKSPNRKKNCRKSQHFVPPCSFDWCFVPQYFIRAPHDMSHYKMPKYEISIPATPHAPLSGNPVSASAHNPHLEHRQLWFSFQTKDSSLQTIHPTT